MRQRSQGPLAEILVCSYAAVQPERLFLVVEMQGLGAADFRVVSRVTDHACVAWVEVVGAS